MASIWLTAKHAWLLLVDTNFPRLYTVQCTLYSLPIGPLTGLWISYWSKNCENFLGGNLRERARRDAVWKRRTDARRESISGTQAQLWESVQPSRWSANWPADLLLVDFSFGLNAGAAINPARDMGPRILTALVGWPDTFSVSMLENAGHSFDCF